MSKEPCEFVKMELFLEGDPQVILSSISKLGEIFEGSGVRFRLLAAYKLEQLPQIGDDKRDWLDEQEREHRRTR